MIRVVRIFEPRSSRGLSFLVALALTQGAVHRGPSGTLLLTPRVALAQEGDEALVAARAKFQRALELKAAGDFSGALALFREVGQVKMTPQVRYHIASCEESLGRLVAAYGGYDLALKQGQGMPQDFIVEVEGALARLNERIPKLVLERGEGADAATIELDGVVLGATSIGQEIPVDPGPHSISAKAPGHKAFSMTVDAEEAKTQSVEVVLLPEEQRVDVRPPPPPPPPPQGYGPWPFIIGGTGLGIAAVGVVLLPVSQSDIGRAKELCLGTTDCTQSSIPAADRDEAKRIVDSARTLETVGWAMMGVGLVAAGVGTVLYVIDPARRYAAEKRAAQARPLDVQVGAKNTDFGLTLSGSF